MKGSSCCVALLLAGLLPVSFSFTLPSILATAVQKKLSFGVPGSSNSNSNTIAAQQQLPLQKRQLSRAERARRCFQLASGTLSVSAINAEFNSENQQNVNDYNNVYNVYNYGNDNDSRNTNNKEVDEVLDALVKTESAQPIILQWSPQRSSIWSRWKGTVWQTTARPTLALSALSLLICLIARKNNVLPGLGIPVLGTTSRFFASMQRLERLWQMHLTVLSFFLAFYLNTAKALFDSVLVATRQVQGRLNDMNLIAASHAKRCTMTGEMTAASQELCSTLGRYTRLFSVLHYSSLCHRYACVLTPAGLKGMQKRGLLTQEEAALLKNVPPTARNHAVLTWIMATFTAGCEEEDESTIRQPANAHFAFLLRMTDLRSSCATITDLVDARCPLAYVHLVQLLVDTFLLLTPFAALGADMGWFSVGATFLLSAFFTGLMDLAKMLYDPLDNEVFGDIDNIQVDTLIQETNNGSLRFAMSGAQLPMGARGQSSYHAANAFSGAERPQHYFGQTMGS